MTIRLMLCAGAASLALGAALLQPRTASADDQQQARPQAPAAGAPVTAGITPDLVAAILKGLRETPGCLGADVGQLQSGKNVIFGWFESKAAAMAWYGSPIHQRATAIGYPERDANRKAMADVPDDIGPMMAVACAIPVPPEERKEGQPAFRIGIELYSPLPGGVRFGGGSFAPEGFKAPAKK